MMESVNSVLVLSQTSPVALEGHHPLGITRLTSQSVRSFRAAIRDDNLQTQQEELERQNTLMSNMEGDIVDELQSVGRPSLDASIHDVPPDGGLDAWLLLAALFMLMVATWGLNAASGVILQFYLNNEIFAGATEYDFALITSIVVCLAQALAPIATLSIPILGFHRTLLVGVCVNFAGYLLASFAVNIWQLYLTQGVLVGAAFSFMFIPGTTIIPQWFLKKRALASGTVVSGSGLGGIIFSLSVNRIIHITGSQVWALRYLCLATTFLGAVATAMIRPRNYKKAPVTRKYFVEQARLLLDFSIFKEFSPLCVSVWFVFSFLAYAMELYTLADYGTSVGLSANQGSAITAIFNVGQFFGRPLLGFVADKVGRINLTLYITTFNIITLFAWWLNSFSYGSLIAYALISGACMGVGNLMMQPLAADNVSHPSKFPAAYCLVNFIGGMMSLISEVIPILLRKPHSSKPYLDSQIYGGCLLCASLITLLILRGWKMRKMTRKRLEKTNHSLENGDYIEDEKCTAKMKNSAENQDLVSYSVLQMRKQQYEHRLRGGLIPYIEQVFYPVII